MEERPIFVETNIGTHMAVSVSSDAAVAELKDKLVTEHFMCFPERGQFKVCRLMVRRKMYFYHLPDSVHIKYIFPDFRRCVFLFMDLCPLEKQFRPLTFMQNYLEYLSKKGRMDDTLSIHFASEVRGVANSGDVTMLGMETEGTKCRLIPLPSNMRHSGANGMKAHELEDDSNPNEVPDSNMKHCSLDQTVKMSSHLNSIYAVGAESRCNDLSRHKNRKGCGSSSPTQNQDANSSECMSISDIISQYFCDHDEIASSSNAQANNSEQLWNHAQKAAGSPNSLMREKPIESAAREIIIGKKVAPCVDMVSKVTANKKEQHEHLHQTKKRSHSLSVKKNKAKERNNKLIACDNFPAKDVCGKHPSSTKTPPAHSASTRVSNGNIREDEVGRCILRAAENMSNHFAKMGLEGAYPENKLCYMYERSLRHTYSLDVRSSIFEISDDEG